MHMPHFIYSAASEHLDCSHFLVTMNNVVKKTYVQAFVYNVFNSLEFSPRSGIAGSYRNKLFKELPSCFPNVSETFVVLQGIYSDSVFSIFLPTFVLSF